MPTPKHPVGSYSTWLRARRQQRARPTTATGSAVAIGGWLLADEDGALVIVNRATGARTVLMGGGS